MTIQKGWSVQQIVLCQFLKHHKIYNNVLVNTIPYILD